MERLQSVSLTRADLQTILVDPAAPYFGHLRLREEVRGRGVVERDVLIGRATFVDAGARINIVDWRHAPVSQLFYRYAEGSDYEERFGDRDVEGEIVARRILTIEGGRPAPGGLPAGGLGARRRRRLGSATDLPTHELAGGEQTATPARRAACWARRRPGARRSIATCPRSRRSSIRTSSSSSPRATRAWSSSRAAPAAARPPSGCIASATWRSPTPTGSRPRRLVVVTCGAALAAYIGQLLPSLGVAGVRGADLRRAGGARAARGDPLAARRPSSTRPSRPSRGSRATRRCCTSWSARGGGSRGQEDLARGRRALGRPADRSGAPAGAAGERGRDADRRARRRRGPPDHDRPGGGGDGARSARGGRPSDRSRAEAAAPSARRARARPDMHWTAMGLEHKPGQRTVDSDLPEGMRRVEGGGFEIDDDDDDDQNIRGDTGIDGLRTEDDRAAARSRRRGHPPARAPAPARREAPVRAPVRRRGAGSVADEAVRA